LPAVVVPTTVPLLDSVMVLLASAVPAMLIVEALVCEGTVVVITGAVGGLGAGGGGSAGSDAGATKVVFMTNGSTIESELDCNDDAAPGVFELELLETVASIVSVKGNDALLSDGEKLIGRAPPGKSSKFGFVVEPFC